MLEKCVLTFLELNWNKRLGHKKTKLNICHHMLTSSTQLQNRSFHVVERTRTSSKCQKMKYARAKHAKILFSIVKYANLWGFCCRHRRGCLSSLLKIDCRNAKLHFQMTFSLPSPSCLLKLPSSSGGILVRSLASHQSGPGSIPRLSVIFWLSLLVLHSALRGFSCGYSGFSLSSKT